MKQRPLLNPCHRHTTVKESDINHCSFKALCLLALLFLVSSPSSAQTHPCGGARAGNEVQVGEAPGGNGVAPTPLCDWVNGNQSQPSQPPPERWQDNWGAIATYEPNGSLGVATDMPSQGAAENAALLDCQSKHGSACKIQISYINQCAAMVVGGKYFNVDPGVTLDKAVQAGMNTCRTYANDCHVYYSACSLPQRIQ